MERVKQLRLLYGGKLPKLESFVSGLCGCHLDELMFFPGPRSDGWDMASIQGAVFRKLQRLEQPDWPGIRKKWGAIPFKLLEADATLAQDQDIADFVLHDLLPAIADAVGGWIVADEQVRYEGVQGREQPPRFRFLAAVKELVRSRTACDGSDGSDDWSDV